jgi:centrosomal protein CEP44
LFLPIVHHILLGYSSQFSIFLSEKGFDLYAKSDLRFIESVYKLMLNQFNYRPAITVHQFFQTGFAERKIHMCIDLAHIVKTKQAELSTSKRVKNTKPKTETLYSPPDLLAKPEESKQGMIKVIKHEPNT